MILLDCPERIACDVCVVVCRQGVIAIRGPLTGRPAVVNPGDCRDCGLCVAHCPGQAVFLVGGPEEDGRRRVTLPYELGAEVAAGQLLVAVDNQGRALGPARLIRVLRSERFNGTSLLRISVPAGIARRVRGVRLG